MVCVLPATGCKTGSSLSKPSWWTFGGGPKVAGDSLASAPPYSGDIKKPSETAKPYPTTSTPAGYAIGSPAAGPADTAAQPFQGPTPQAPVVYGTTPPPVATTASAAPAAPPAQATAIAPQVGPYAATGGDPIPPPGQPLPPIAPSMSAAMPSMAAGSGMGASGMPATSSTLPAEAALPNTAYSAFSSTPSGAGAVPAMPQPAPRLADARGSDPAAPIPAAALPAAAAVSGGSRYSSQTASRFSGSAEAASFQPNVGAPPAAYGNPVEQPYTPAAPAAQPIPSGGPATPGLLQPSANPVRRPDPVYRPFGTSSYRPSRAILAEDLAPAGVGVQTAAYEEPAGGTIRQ